MTQTYPSGRTVTNTYDSAGRANSVSGNLGDGAGRTYSTGIAYASGGQMTQEQFGTATPIYNKLFYNSRGQLAEIRESTTPNDASWNRGAIINSYGSSDNNGNLRQQDAYIPHDDQVSNYTFWQTGFGYDSLNRLTNHTEITNLDPPVWQQAYDYDRYGNRTINQQWTSGPGIPKPQFNVDLGTNRLTVPNGQSGAMNYDAAGNLTFDSYTGEGARAYDAENRMTQAWGNDQWQFYSYDGDGRRVKRNVNGAETWQVYGRSGELLAEYAANSGASTPQKEYAYRNGQLLVTAEPTASIHWLVADQLGTPRMVFDGTGSLSGASRHDYLAFGEELYAGIGRRSPELGYTGDGTRQKFTQKERDNETGLDFFEARYYGSNMGHFTSPDPGGLLTQNQEYPQSWNLYEYVHNNPLTNIDPTGLDCAYANDAGNGVESIDHHSSSGECRQTGGSWVPGYANESWAHFNRDTHMFQVGSLSGSGSSETVNYTMFEAGAQTQFNANETACTSGCSGFSQANADWLQAQFVGNNKQGGLDKYIEFLATRKEPLKGGIFMKILAGPLKFWTDHWAGQGGFGPPGGQGDWAATIHDYNWNLNGPDEVHGINILMGLNPRLPPEVSKAFIQSNSALYRHAGGLQGAKMRLVFGVVNVFQKITH